MNENDAILVFCVEGMNAYEKVDEIMHEIKHSHSTSSTFFKWSIAHKHEMERAFWFGGWVHSKCEDKTSVFLISSEKEEIRFLYLKP